MMEQRLSIITLGVADLARARRFYTEGLGWRASAQSQKTIVFIPLNGFVLSLYERSALVEDAFGKEAAQKHRAAAENAAAESAAAKSAAADSAAPNFTLAHNVRTVEEVAQTLQFAQKAGAKLIKKAQKVFWGGTSGYFADLDGFLWEVAHNPHAPLAANGDLRMDV